jgi:hypothetical protein
MRWLTQDASLKCDHGGVVSVATKQDFVRIAKRLALTEPNTENRPIAGCPNASTPAGIVPCRTTETPREGLSTLITINGLRVCLETVCGFTDGQPLKTSNYTVLDPAQTFVEARQ